MSVQSTSWLFTAYDPEPWAFEPLKYVKYYVAQHEMCPKTERLHLQGYIELEKRKTLGGLKKLLNSKTTHFEKRRGSQLQAIQYCTKPDTRVDVEKVVKELLSENINPNLPNLASGPEGAPDGGLVVRSECAKCAPELLVCLGLVGEFGDRGKQGERTDIKAYIENCKEKFEEEMMNDYPELWGRYTHLYDRVKTVKYQNKPRPAPYVIVFCGTPGSGKSRTARVLGDFLGSVYWKSGNGKWWPGYDNQTVTVIDDIDWRTFDHQMLLQILDRYPIQVEIKGGTRWLTSEFILITCNDMNWAQTKQVKRRLHEIIYFNPEHHETSHSSSSVYCPHTLN